MKRATQEGVEGLRHKPPPGATPRLSEQERASRLPELLDRGAEAHGFRGELWTCERVAQVIRREFGVRAVPPGSCESFAQGVEPECAQATAEG
jgi:transposase